MARSLDHHGPVGDVVAGFGYDQESQELVDANHNRRFNRFSLSSLEPNEIWNPMRL